MQIHAYGGICIWNITLAEKTYKDIHCICSPGDWMQCVLHNRQVLYKWELSPDLISMGKCCFLTSQTIVQPPFSLSKVTPTGTTHQSNTEMSKQPTSRQANLARKCRESNVWGIMPLRATRIKALSNDSLQAMNELNGTNSTHMQVQRLILCTASSF